MTATRNIASVKHVVTEIQREGGTVVQQLSRLVERFNLAARAVDPTITGAWVGYEDERPHHPSYIAFERNHKPLFGVGMENASTLSLLDEIAALEHKLAERRKELEGRP